MKKILSVMMTAVMIVLFSSIASANADSFQYQKAQDIVDEINRKYKTEWTVTFDRAPTDEEIEMVRSALENWSADQPELLAAYENGQPVRKDKNG